LFVQISDYILIFLFLATSLLLTFNMDLLTKLDPLISSVFLFFFFKKFDHFFYTYILKSFIFMHLLEVSHSHFKLL